MLAAGVASLAAAVVTSRFGVAGTILGAALTTMIITGGSAIVKSHLETLSGHVKSVPQRIRAGRTRMNRTRAGRGSTATADRDDSNGTGGMAVYGRGRNNGDQGFFGRLRSSFGWFSRLSNSHKRNILFGAAVPAVVAFFIAMSAITSVELLSGRTLSCITGGSECQVAAADGSSSGSRTTFGEIASAARPSGGSQQPLDQQLSPPEVAPNSQNNPSGGTATDDGSGFFGQPSGGGNSGVPSGSEQPVDPSEAAPEVVPEAAPEAVPEAVPDGGVAPSGVAPQGQPSDTQSAPVQ